jgi:ribosomal protein L11 methyltransferase
MDEVVEAFERVAPGRVTVEERRPGFWTAESEPPRVAYEVTLFLEDDARLEDRRRRLEARLDAVRQKEHLPRLSVRRLAATDWKEAWKRRHTRRRVGERLLVIPAWDPDPVPPDSIAIRLAIGQAFGLGTHVSTRLCLGLLERILTPGARVIDVGSGSGILGIAALRLGAGEVRACDIDPLAVNATLANALLNHVDDRLVAREGGVDAFRGPADLVLANIVAEVILDHLDALRAPLDPAGRLLLGGIRVEQLGSVQRALRTRGLAVQDTRREEGFVAVVTGPPPSAPSTRPGSRAP